MKKPFVPILAAIGITASAPQAIAQHAHLNAGAQSTNQNAQLMWANGADFVANSGYVKTLEHTNGGRYAGYYQGGITLTALPATASFGGPDPAASALGSYIQCRMSCLETPPGGEFAFWEAGARRTRPFRSQPGRPAPISGV